VTAGEEFILHVRGHRLHMERFGSRDAPLVLGLPGLPEVDANHLTINTHRQTPNVIKRFLDGVLR
jgi:hypothetical protein